MENQVIFRDRQELQAADFTNLQDFIHGADQHLVTDAITPESLFVGLTVSVATATSLNVAAGRLYVGSTGDVYSKAQAEEISVFPYLPVTDQKYLAVAVSGSEVESNQEPRDFLIDLETGETEPQTVTMLSAKVIAIYLTEGFESTAPQKPAAATGHTLIAYVKLGPSGILEIEMATNKALPNLHDVNQRVIALEDWQDVIAPAVSGIGTDLAKLTDRVATLPLWSHMIDALREIGRLKDLQSLPDAYVGFGQDYLLTEDETDTEHADHTALTQEGIRIPWAATTEQALSLFNPLETAVKSHSGFILPAYTEITGLALRPYGGELSLSQYQSQTFDFKMGQMTRARLRYGASMNVCTNGAWWKSGAYDPRTGIFIKDGETWQVTGFVGNYGQGHEILRVTRFWYDWETTPYMWVTETTVQINGSQLAQTFLQQQNRWLTAINLYLTQVAASGTLYVQICEVTNGKPDPTKCIASTSVVAAALKTYPNATKIVLTTPVYLEAGKRYAIALVTTGNHYTAIVSGTQYTQGTMFYSTDGAYFQGDFTKDIMFDLLFAQFVNPRTEVQLSPISLTGGITDLDLLAELVQPESTRFVLEYQKDGAGTWVPVDAAHADALTGLPQQLNLRAVFIGTTDLMPGIALAGSRLRAQRPNLAGVHVSAERTLATPSDDIKVRLRLESFDAAHNTCTCVLLNGASTYSPDSTTDQVVAGGIERTFAFTPADGVGISSYQIKTTLTTDNIGYMPHVAERFDWAV